MEIFLDDFGLEWKRKDETIHKADYDDLIIAYENKRTYDKEIRDKAIDTFMIAIETHMKIVGNTYLEDIREIAERLKEVNNG